MKRKSVSPPQQQIEQPRTFPDLLDFHLDNGTRPSGNPTVAGRRWSNKELAEALGVSDRTIRYWRDGTSRPADLESLERELFGNNRAYDRSRQELRMAFNAAGKIEPSEGPAADPRPVMPILPPDRCFGRQKHVAALSAALTTSDDATIVVLGAPGIGKTTLTREVAASKTLANHFAHRRWFVPLENAHSASEVETEVVRAIGLNPANATFGQALAQLARRRSLIVIDNLETPWEADPSDVQTTLQRVAAVPGISLLVSLRGSRPPLSPHWTSRILLQPLADVEARHLFLTIAPNIGATDPALIPLLRELGGVPLAIELVAYRATPHDSLHDLWEEWEQRGVALASHPDLPVNRRTSVERSIDLSLHSSRLHDAGRRLFRLLGQLPAGVGREDRLALLEGDAARATDALLAIGLAFARDGRLDMLSPIRDFARRTHPPIGGDAALWCEHYLTLARELGRRILRKGGNEAAARLVSEIPNIEAAVCAALDMNKLAEALSAHRALALLIRTTGMGSSNLISRMAEACCQAGDRLGEANCIRSLGEIALGRSDHDAARRAFEEALPLYRQLGAVCAEADCIHDLGDIALYRSDYDEAHRSYDEALQLFRQAEDVRGQAICINSLGRLALRRSDHDAARRAFEEALPLHGQIGSALGEANCVRSLGDIALRRSDHDAARRAYEKALPLYRQVGDRLGEANCVHGLGEIALERWDPDAAQRAFEEALPLYRQVNDVSGEAGCVRSLGDVARNRSDHEEAHRAYNKALSLFREIGNVHGMANCIHCLGAIALKRSDHEEARHAFNEALLFYRKTEDVHGEATSISRLGDIALQCGDYDAAHRAYKEALLLYRKAGGMRGAANCIYDLGEIARRQSDKDAAGQAYEEALQLYRQIEDVGGAANCRLRLGQIALQASSHETAGQAFEEAQQLYRQIDDVLGEANCIYCLGEIALERSDHDAARQAYEQAAPLYEQIGDERGEANCRRGLLKIYGIMVARGEIRWEDEEPGSDAPI